MGLDVAPSGPSSEDGGFHAYWYFCYKLLDQSRFQCQVVMVHTGRVGGEEGPVCESYLPDTSGVVVSLCFLLLFCWPSSLPFRPQPPRINWTWVRPAASEIWFWCWIRAGSAFVFFDLHLKLDLNLTWNRFYRSWSGFPLTLLQAWSSPGFLDNDHRFASGFELVAGIC